ncbi:PREDICTED: uncharacterized protein LOC105451622 [Wasmannia auropunctata]|uniref:uncharacterized protein LOC105451622 n=1 Tax=Wasmannia auropunctata TaxID=64793 RepID=UPI0005F04ECD|nr:PREDICTED: uncharacterized protein LOC105451622 [Wasmannia auropunctata]
MDTWSILTRSPSATDLQQSNRPSRLSVLSPSLTELRGIARAIYYNFKKIGKNNYTPAKIRSRIATLKETWVEFRHGHAALLQAVPKDKREAVEYFNEDKLEVYEEVYQTAADYMAECLEEIEPPVSPNRSAEFSYVQPESSSISLKHLPPIKLPPFSGKFEEWETFRDRFKTLIIHNRELSDFARMHFLASSLTGPARDAIESTEITADNFAVAWAALCTRYENKRRLIDINVSILYNLPPITRESPADLHALRDKAEKAIASLKRLDRAPADMLNDILVYFLSQKLDPATRKAWTLKSGKHSEPSTYEDLCRFISARASALEELTPSNSYKSTKSTKVLCATTSSVPSAACPLCKERHFINKCPQFINKSPSQRRDIVKEAKRCENCLSTKHDVMACPSKYACRNCQQRHHSMLHIDSISSLEANLTLIAENQPSQSTDTQQVRALFSSSASPSLPPVLLATARVTVSSSSGRSASIRALLDQGSEATFISENLAQLLRLRRKKMPVSITAVGCVNAGSCRYGTQIIITSRHDPSSVFTTTALILTSLTTYAPRHCSRAAAWPHIADLRLADDNPMSSEPIDLIIGADLYSNLILDGIRKGSPGQPIAQNSCFGWILSGPITLQNTYTRHIATHHCSLEQSLRQFWEIEEIPRQAALAPEEQLCETHFITTHTRSPDGRYCVRLPFKEGPPIAIGESRSIAERMLLSLTRRFKANPEQKTEYSEFLAEYEQLGHMWKVNPPSLPSNQYVYIPHHPVIRETSITTRLRVVFNASSLTKNGTSLNHHLLASPKLQSDLPAVLLRWRQYKYVYSADIAKMYRQIRIDPRDVDYQRILWIGDDSNAISEYQLLTVTYGTATAPFLALRVLKQLITDEGDAFPLAAPVLRDNTYVDDLLFGADDISTLRHTRAQVCALLAHGGFELRKWASNSSDLLADIPPDNHGLACSKSLQSDDKLKILGINWNPSVDAFQIQVDLPDAMPKTKRTILATIARLFDPLGWVTPATVAAKVFMQQLWRLKLNWDDIIPESTLLRWKSIYTTLSALNGQKISRWTGQDSDISRCELHGFADASTVAYGAAVYIRVASRTGEATTALLAGKSKVAPVDPITVPRLELLATVLLARLMEFVITTLNLVSVPCHCWTDSTVTLAWLGHPSKWKTFVANRVADVHSRLPNAEWHHISTTMNPADCASRGILGHELAYHKLWWQGPDWLCLSPSEWPKSEGPLSDDANHEAKPITSHIAQPTVTWDLAFRYSSWPKLIRITAYVIRFTLRCRQKYTSRASTSPHSLALSPHDCKQARLFWLKSIQREVFPEERHLLMKGHPLPARSSILSLNPFLDADELIRVGGRLRNAPLSFNVKYPILLSSHSLVTLIIRQAHLRSLHAGSQLTIATLRQEFWILRARNLVKSVIHQCVECTRERAAIPSQLMGNLPKVRVSPSTRAFLHCGVDYAGPVAVRASAGRGITSRKAYIAVFICLTTRAIHLELVGSYNTSAFLAAYSRFCARRGLPISMYSDNGTTFVGANKELKSAYRAALQNPDFLNRTASDGVSWQFIPPHAPHFGGLWEAGVRSMKHHLRRTLGSHTLTVEEFTTMLYQVEACLNSRPLGPLTDSLSDYEPLTPGHFLIGSAITTAPEPSLLDLNENRLSRWQLVRQIAERFWKLWKHDYVNTLQQRVKWRKPQPSIQVGQLVLLRNSALPPCKWELGRVTQCHAGTDTLVRVVTVKTATSEYQRPIEQLCLLPIDVNPPAINEN